MYIYYVILAPVSLLETALPRIIVHLKKQTECQLEGVSTKLPEGMKVTGKLNNGNQLLSTGCFAFSSQDCSCRLFTSAITARQIYWVSSKTNGGTETVIKITTLARYLIAVLSVWDFQLTESTETTKCTVCGGSKLLMRKHKAKEFHYISILACKFTKVLDSILMFQTILFTTV